MNLLQCRGVVTSAPGLGAETARYLAKAGAKVNAITSMRCASAVADDHIGWLAIRYNVSDAAAAEAVFQRARDVHGFARSRQLRRPGARAAHSRR